MLPLTALYDDPSVLRGLADRIAVTVGGCEERVALSTLQLGLTARLLTLGIGCAAGQDAVPVLDPAMLLWDDDRGSVRLQPPSAPPLPGATVAALAALVVDEVLDRNAAPLIDAVRREVPLATGLLWGNVASGVLGTARVIGSPRALDIAAAVLADPRLRDAGEARGGHWRRRSCCLFYRVAGAGVCGDCAFEVAPRIDRTAFVAIGSRPATR